MDVCGINTHTQRVNPLRWPGSRHVINSDQGQLFPGPVSIFVSTGPGGRSLSLPDKPSFHTTGMLITAVLPPIPGKKHLLKSPVLH